MDSSDGAQRKSNGLTSICQQPAFRAHDELQPSIQTAKEGAQATTLGDKELIKDDTYSPIDELREGAQSALKVLLCRKWDATNPFGKYISTEYIVSDEKGNAIHYIARSNISHCFLSKLEEGNIYILKNFTVKPNKESFRIRNTDDHMIELEGNTIVKKIESSHDGFQRYPFDLIRIEDINLNGCKYLIDVIGCVTNVSQGARIRVTLWGAICDVLVKNAAHAEGFYPAIFPSMNVKEFRGEVYLPSTSATAILDGHNIPQISDFKSLLKNTVLQGTYNTPDEVSTKEASLLQLLHMGREQRASRGKSITFRCKVKISNIRTKNSWYYFSCGAGK